MSTNEQGEKGMAVKRTMDHGYLMWSGMDGDYIADQIEAVCKQSVADGGNNATDEQRQKTKARAANVLAVYSGNLVDALRRRPPSPSAAGEADAPSNVVRECCITPVNWPHEPYCTAKDARSQPPSPEAGKVVEEIENVTTPIKGFSWREREAAGRWLIENKDRLRAALEAAGKMPDVEKERDEWKEKAFHLDGNLGAAIDERDRLAARLTEKQTKITPSPTGSPAARLEGKGEV